MTPGEVIMHGGLLAALPLAAAAGFLSFASPCVLPVVPGYLGLIGATSGPAGPAVPAEGRGGTTSARAVPRSRLALGAMLFVLGFSLVYVLSGAAFGQLGFWLLQHQGALLRVLGVVVALMGLVFIGRLPFLQRTLRLPQRPVGLAGAPLLGMVFGLGWAPCLGPTLIAIQALGFQSAAAGRGALLAFAYCLGLGLPFVLLAFGFGAATRAAGWLRRRIRTVNLIGGGLLVLIGLLMVTGVWQSFIAAIGALVPGYVTPL
ncbi:MAG: cytochrome c biogenesis CcdA family protein [Pseudoclavibacter sp.]|nr:cytochrome c biogenesis CcdA family protein [Pseudoclavibacter sp.]